MSVNSDKDKNGTQLNTDEFEKVFQKQTEEMKRRRREYYRIKGVGRAPDKIPGENTVYKAREALKNSAERKKRGEGFIRRTVRLIKRLIAKRRQLSDHSVYSFETRRREYLEIAKDCYSPAYNFAVEAIDAAWNFIVQLFQDFWDVVLYVCDLFIKAWYYLRSLASFIWDWMWDVRFWMGLRKHSLVMIFSFVIAAAAVSAVFVNSITAYEYYYHGKLLGVARTKNDVYKTITVLGDKLSEASGANVSLDMERDIEFNQVRGLGLDVHTSEDILDTLTYMRELQVYAYAINIDGQQQVILESEFVAKNMLSSIQTDYTKAAEGVEYTSVEFDQIVTITEVTAQLGDIWNSDDAKTYLMSVGSDGAPRLTVTSRENATYTENINYGTKYVENASMYADETEVISNGIYGINRIVAEVVRKNGEETNRIIISTTKVSDPVDAVVYRGTKPIPPSDGTGTFIIPTSNYTISSRFGMRWGRMHNGVDFAASTGTKIYASDGGTVTYAGWKNSYGYVVMIDHGGLYESVYAHCSKLLVSAGDEVYQGKSIALVGSTGNSTGPHLHFEIHYKGVPYNPLNYL